MNKYENCFKALMLFGFGGILVFGGTIRTTAENIGLAVSTLLMLSGMIPIMILHFRESKINDEQ